jgi:uncharacterized protein (DUF1330 family)
MVYVVAQLTIHDRERHRRHTSGVMAVLEPYGGWLLASDRSPEAVEGTWERDKVVLRALADRSAYAAWASSEADPRIAQDRIAASDGPVLLAQGIG